MYIQRFLQLVSGKHKFCSVILVLNDDLIQSMYQVIAVRPGWVYLDTLFPLPQELINKAALPEETRRMYLIFRR